MINMRKEMRANILSSVSVDDSGRCLLADRGEQTPVALHTDHMRIYT